MNKNKATLLGHLFNCSLTSNQPITLQQLNVDVNMIKTIS